MSVARTASIQRFKQMTTELQRDIRRDAIAELNASADILVQQMKAVAPVGPTGNLKASIRKVPGKSETRVRVMAGGAMTTVQMRRGASYQRQVNIGSGDTAGIAKGGEFGVAYDYSMAVEFGTQQAGAHPFFWPSWRLRRKRIRASMKRKITSNIKKRSAE